MASTAMGWNYRHYCSTLDSAPFNKTQLESSIRHKLVTIIKTIASQRLADCRSRHSWLRRRHGDPERAASPESGVAHEPAIALTWTNHISTKFIREAAIPKYSPSNQVDSKTALLSLDPVRSTLKSALVNSMMLAIAEAGTLPRLAGHDSRVFRAAESGLCGKRRFRHLRDTPERHARALMLVCPEPAGHLILNLSDQFEQFLIQPAVADRPVAALYIRIWSQFARLNVFGPEVTPLYTRQQHAAGVSRALVAADRLGLTSLFDDLV